MSNLKSYYICQGCKKTITDPKDGLVFQGNVYVADANLRGGLIGNNFPYDENSEDDTPFRIEDVKESVYCMKCTWETFNVPDDIQSKERKGRTKSENRG